ncbi:hypothetical protein [Tenacibaculum maritimum]|uniref:hypothetical protein n=1 Tax=Tenacibaculum maritimum TaxID=107401 RepID=UPI001E5697B9|nr:hypothetical protein [Tenacibaculum maritimum]MCD9612227.1 hypothetical protein [Tenacibaculum maritimum]
MELRGILKSSFVVLLCAIMFSCKNNSHEKKKDIIEKITNLKLENLEIQEIDFFEFKINEDLDYLKKYLIRIEANEPVIELLGNSVKKTFYYDYDKDSVFFRKTYSIHGFWDLQLNDLIAEKPKELGFWKPTDSLNNLWGSFYSENSPFKFVEYNKEWNGKALAKIEKKNLYILIDIYELPKE